MKVLVVSDVEYTLLYDHFRKERVAGVELIISCGDLKQDYLDTQNKSAERTLDSLRKGFLHKFVDNLLRVIAPLL